MNNHSHPESVMSQIPEAVRNLAIEAAERTDFTTDELTDAAKRAGDTAKEYGQTALVKAEEALAISKEYVRRNPVPVFLGAIAVGAALGYMVMMTRRKPTFGERYADEPMAAVREALLGAFAPVAQRVHGGYDSALIGAGKAMDRMHHFGSGRSRNSLSHRFGRIGSNLKFW